MSAAAIQAFDEDRSRQWSRDGNKYSIRAPVRESSQEIVAEIEGDCVAFRAELVRLDGAPEFCRRALGHFLGALNSRLRLARGFLRDESVVLEAVFPAAAFTPDQIDKAVGSLTVGAKLAHRECAALLDPNITQQYLAFHSKGEI